MPLLGVVCPGTAAWHFKVRQNSARGSVSLRCVHAHVDAVHSTGWRPGRVVELDEVFDPQHIVQPVEAGAGAPASRVARTIQGRPAAGA